MSHGNGISDIYKSVIADVISNMKEAFLDENIDIDVLAQLKKEWEDKVNSSGCVDLDSNPPPPAPRQHPPNQPVRPNPMAGNSSGSQHRIPINQHTIRPNMPQMSDGPLRMAYTTQTQPPQQIRVFNPQQFHGGLPFQGNQMFVVQQPNGQSIPMSVIPQGMRIVHQGQPGQGHSGGNGSQNQLSHMNQMDGNGEGSSEGSGPLKDQKTGRSAKSTLKVRGKVRGYGASQKKAMKVLGSMLKEVQLDGGGGGMSDSSSDEEQEDEDDPLRRIADRIGNEDVEDGDAVAEEEPLNSEDDQSDDEDLTSLFDADNVVMCQFEKVNRARTKWKFQLKDGIMHIDKKDYCFQKCSGEAEW